MEERCFFKDLLVGDLAARIRNECLKTMEDSRVTKEHRLMGALAFQRLQQLANTKKTCPDELKFDKSLSFVIFLEEFFFELVFNSFQAFVLRSTKAQCPSSSSAKSTGV